MLQARCRSREGAVDLESGKCEGFFDGGRAFRPVAGVAFFSRGNQEADRAWLSQPLQVTEVAQSTMHLLGGLAERQICRRDVDP